MKRNNHDDDDDDDIHDDIKIAFQKATSGRTRKCSDENGFSPDDWEGCEGHLPKTEDALLALPLWEKPVYAEHGPGEPGSGVWKSIINNKMDTFFKFESSKEHYTAEACIFWCYDARFSDLYIAFLAERKFSNARIDLVKGAGGAQALALGSGPDRDVAASQLAKSIKLHHTERVILMVHMDCGGYGGSKAFDNDHKKEWDHHAGELKKADAFVRATFPGIKEIECSIADFDGLHSIH